MILFSNIYIKPYLIDSHLSSDPYARTNNLTKIDSIIYHFRAILPVPVVVI